MIIGKCSRAFGPIVVKYFSKTSLLKSKIYVLENYAKKNQLHKLRMDNLFEVFKLAETEEDYKLSLHLLNIYYNLGKNLNTQQDVNLFFIFILRTKQLHEAKDFLQYFNGWLLCPPSNKYIIHLMEHFFVEKKYKDVREIFSFVRKNSQIKLESCFYSITIKAMLMLTENPIEEAMIIYDDSYNMSIYLPNDIHNLLLEHCLFDYHKKKIGDGENRVTLEFLENNISNIIIRLINELIKNRTSIRLSSKSLTLFAWSSIYFNLKEIMKKANHILRDVEECENWLDILKLACLYNQDLHCNNGPFSIFFKEVLKEMNSEDARKALEYINKFY